MGFPWRNPPEEREIDRQISTERVREKKKDPKNKRGVDRESDRGRAASDRSVFEISFVY